MHLASSSNATSLPGVQSTAVIIDPKNPSNVYVGTQVGVYVGTILGDKLDWKPLDFGLPNGVDVQDLWLNTSNRNLMVATYGYGAYLYDLENSAQCAQSKLLIRDNVFDTGTTPSPFDLPDPEHPTTDKRVGDLQFYKPNDTEGNKVYWWDSSDIRVDIPSLKPVANQLSATVDNFEFEGCPVEASSCNPGTMIDSDPVRGTDANVYVQLQQRGLGPVSNVRVMTLFTDATTEVPPLPADFWTKTFPPRDASGNGGCGPIDPANANGWQMVGCASGFGPVEPGVPEIAWFPWKVPDSAADHSCMVTLIDSGQDQVTAATRQLFRVEDIVPNSPLVAQRNLHIISPPAAALSGTVSMPYTGLASVWVPNYTDQPAVKDTLLAYGSVGLGKLSFLLPYGVQVPGLPSKCGMKQQGSGVSLVRFPKGFSEADVTLAATHRLFVGPGTKVLEAQGGFGTVANAGKEETIIGPNATVGALVSEAPTFVGSNASVRGALTTSDGVYKAHSATIDGPEQLSAVLTPDAESTWTVPAFDGASDVLVGPRHTRKLPPGAYRDVGLAPFSTLILSSGIYRIHRLFADSPSSSIQMDTAGGAITVYVEEGLEVRAPVVDQVSGGSGGLFVVLGDHAATGRLFQASLVAPYAREMELGEGPSAELAGTFFGRNVIVHPQTRITHKAFLGWGSIGACTPLTPDEQSKAVSLGLDPSAVYPVADYARHIMVPVDAKSKVRIGLRYESGSGRANSAGRFRAISMENGKVRGGSTFIVRH
jgi:hypothetical protein